MSFTVRQLGPETWEDFELLFSPGTGWGFCACMLYQRGCHLDRRVFDNREKSRRENHRQKRALVNAGDAHGILVYDNLEPIGWCQFGPVSELPLPGATRLDRRIPPLEPGIDWRITCFVTRRRHRHRGVATAALRGAIGAIAGSGGGVVEAFPTTTPENVDWQHAGTLALLEPEGFTVHQRPDAPYVIVRRDVLRSAI